jgi:hypothetical protein
MKNENPVMRIGRWRGFREESRMPVFSFHLVDATSNSDLGGQEYEDAVQATEVADMLTRRLAVEEPALLGGG